jgi:hypothetical protein
VATSAGDDGFVWEGSELTCVATSAGDDGFVWEGSELTCVDRRECPSPYSRSQRINVSCALELSVVAIVLTAVR